MRKIIRLIANVVMLVGVGQLAQIMIEGRQTTMSWSLSFYLLCFGLIIRLVARDKKTDIIKTPERAAPERTEEEAIAQFRESLLKTTKEVARITAAMTKSRLPVLVSKFGGRPYWPKDMAEYPKFEGKPMFLLAQINFAEVPKMKGYPRTGILQFFIDPTLMTDWKGDDGGWIKRDCYKVIWHKKTIRANNRLLGGLVLPSFETTPLLVPELELKFIHDEEQMSLHDYRFIDQTDEYFLEDIHWKIDELASQYGLKIDGEGHKFGGYLARAQYDNRIKGKDGDYELLLQIDSQYNEKGKKDVIMWGDAGVGNFFIKAKDLQKENFDDVIFTWDCG